MLMLESIFVYVSNSIYIQWHSFSLQLRSRTFSPLWSRLQQVAKLQKWNSNLKLEADTLSSLYEYSGNFHFFKFMNEQIFFHLRTVLEC